MAELKVSKKVLMMVALKVVQMASNLAELKVD